LTIVIFLLAITVCSSCNWYHRKIWKRKGPETSLYCRNNFLCRLWEVTL